MILHAFWLGTLVPISIALIFTSSHLWKKPVFILNACAIACAVAFGAVALTKVKNSLIGRPGTVRDIQPLVFLSCSIPICTHSILLIRILAVYPPRVLPWKKNLLIYGVLAVMLAARIINIGFLLHQTITDLDGSGDIFFAWKSLFVRVDWFLQLFYIMYTSALFLLRLRQGGALTLRRRISTSVPFLIIPQRGTYFDRLRALFWIAVFNFVFPAILNILAIIILFCSLDSVWALTDLVTTNLYLDVVCVLLATIWCSGKYWEPERASPLDEIEFKVTMVASSPPSTMRTGILTSQSTTVFIGQGDE